MLCAAAWEADMSKCENPIDAISRAMHVLRLIESLACESRDLHVVSADSLAMTLDWVIEVLDENIEKLHALARSNGTSNRKGAV